MAVSDTIAFIQERVRVFDPSQDVGEGSLFYQTVLAPLQQRLGPDPFTTDVQAFLRDILARNFPDLALSQVDALTEALVVPMDVALTPVTQEITRTLRSLSLRNPDQLTNEEAADLGANFLQEMERGDTAQGVARIYFNHPQAKRVDLTHTFFTPTGLVFVPREVQTISAEEMLLNQEGSFYYMNVSVVASAPGRQYNLDPHQLSGVRGLTGVVRVTNPFPFRDGSDEQTAQEFIEELPLRVGSEGMSQPGGIINALKRALPSLTRIAVVGHGDPEMQRDVLQGESLGRLHASGFGGSVMPDSEGGAFSRWFVASEGIDGDQRFFDFPTPLVLTFSHPSLSPRTLDAEVRSVLANNILELKERVLPLNLTGASWTLRTKELLLSKTAGIPTDEVVSLPANVVHVGGAIDVYAKAPLPTPSTCTIDQVEDQEPALEGNDLNGNETFVFLPEFTLGSTYTENSDTYRTIQSIWQNRWALEILEGPAQGVYDILNVTFLAGDPLYLDLYDPLPVATSGVRWRIVDRINLDLLHPRKKKWSGEDLETTQGLPVVSSTALYNFLDLGIQAGDSLELLVGRDKGVYEVLGVEGPGNTRLRLNQALTKTAAGIGYQIFRNNAGSLLQKPVLRPTKVELLSPAAQPLGVTVPYGGCLGAVARGISNPARGVKLSVPNALLGIISQRFPAGANITGLRLTLVIEGLGAYTVIFSGLNPIPLPSVADQINLAVGRTIAAPVHDRLGIFPAGDRQVSVVGPPPSAGNSALQILFGAWERVTTKTVRAPSFTQTTFSSLNPALSTDYDVVQCKDGNQVGVYALSGYTQRQNLPASVVDPNALQLDMVGGLRPEADVFIELGARSTGLVRTYFLDPVTVEFDQRTRLRHTQPFGGELVFRPDPQYQTQILPAPPAGAKPKDGNGLAGSKVLNSAVDFRAKRIRKGDLVLIDFVPVFTSALADPVNLAGRTLFLSFGSDRQQKLTFVADDPSLAPGMMTRAGALAQLNRVFGGAVTEDPGGIFRINPEYLFVVGTGGTANSMLGFSTVNETSNRAQNAGTYVVDTPGNLGCILSDNLPFSEARMQYKVLRKGSQRIGATQMSTQVGEGGLFFFDLEVVSEGTGDAFNLVDNEMLDVDGHDTDGYLLSTPDPLFTFSMQDQVSIELPRRVNAVGTNDDLSEATPLQGLQVQVTADTSPEIQEAHFYLRSDTNRDACANPLALALTPHLICLSIDYFDGPTVEEAKEAIETSIHALFPDEELAVDSLVDILKRMGASSIVMPLRIFAVVLDRDRKIRLLSSQDRVSVGRQSAFYPYRINLRRLG
jgi:hypothetical protein